MRTQVTPQTTTTAMKTAAPGEWTLRQVQQQLSKELPPEMLSTRVQQGKRIDYISWHTAIKILNKYCPGWTWEIRNMGQSSDRIFLTGRLTIPTAEGNIYREATGTEELKRLDKHGQLVELAYGDPSSNAESMALRRAAAKFGLGLYLYSK
ncbi:MAG: DUF1071 domain-containing protein [Cyanobacteria bacterium J06588_5]